MKFIAKICSVCLCAFTLFACQPHVPEVEDLPLATIDFSYEVVGDTVYNLAYYVGATIKFYPTVTLTAEDGDITWDFQDGQTQVGDTVYHKFSKAGTYQVTAKSAKGSKTNVIYISDIKPIVSIHQEDSLCVVDSSYVEFKVIVPNPDNLDVEYFWEFPEGTTNKAGAAVATFEGTAEDLGLVKFARVGSQTVNLQVKMGKKAEGTMRNLELMKVNVKVALDTVAPTLYFAVKEGNICAIKIPATPNSKIDYYDMGVSSGQHPLNLLFHKGLLYILDAGKNFTYQNEDAQANGGDGKITIMSKDASENSEMLSNVGGPAFQDPFYGYMDTVTNTLYYSDRNTGIIEVPLATRNETYSADKFKYLVQNNYLGYYGKVGLGYGAITSCFGKIGDTYYWAKTYSGNGIWRFKQEDILQAPVTDKDPIPTSGPVLTAGFFPKTFLYNTKTEDFYLILYSTGEGMYKLKLADLDGITTAKDLPAAIVFGADAGSSAAGQSVKQITVNGMGEGSANEYLGVTQMALDEATGNIYFGMRSNDASVPSGLVMYNAATNDLHYLIEGIQVYGVAINQEPSQLF